MEIEILQHTIKYSYEQDVLPEDMPETEIEHIEECIKDGYIEGELNYYMPDSETENRGYWKIDNLTPEQKAATELLDALNSLYQSFAHVEGNTKGNKAKTDIIKYNPDVQNALNKARNVLTYKLNIA